MKHPALPENHAIAFPPVPEELLAQVPEDAILFPGLFNAHDHLEFNLFPFLASRQYHDYTEWGSDIHEKFHEIIQQTENIPLGQRLLFGILKNLVNGVTRVVHHGRHHSLIRRLTSFPVILNYQYLDAMATEPWWKIKMNLPFTRSPMIHVGEGTNDLAQKEMEDLLACNLLNKPLTGIHAIGISVEQARKFKALVWCPDSNMRLYGRTMNPMEVSKVTTVLFGTDSAVSASPNLFEQLRLVKKMSVITDEGLLQMLTRTAREHFHGHSFHPQDWVMARRKHDHWMDSFFAVNPEDILRVIVDGENWLCDDALPVGQRPEDAVSVLVGEKLKWVHPQVGKCVAALPANTFIPLGIQFRNHG